MQYAYTHDSSLAACEFEDAHVQPCMQVMIMLDWQYVIYCSVEYIIIYVHMQLVIYLCTCVEFIMNECVCLCLLHVCASA